MVRVTLLSRDAAETAMLDALAADEFEPILTRLGADLRTAAQRLSHDQVRWLVDYYYDIQQDRIAAAARVRAAEAAGEPNTVIDWLFYGTRRVEHNIRKALGAYVEGQALGQWATSIPGIGPVLGAGLLAHLDLDHGQTSVGDWWRFAGLDPTVTWQKGQKRPHNGALKRLCWLCGESFVRVQANERDVYGKLYAQRKAYETRKNLAGDYADQAAASLAGKRFGEDTEARKHYEAGRLPPARIHLRAKRWAVKLLLAHYFECAWWERYQALPRKPYILELQPHGWYIGPPNEEEYFPELVDAKRKAGWPIAVNEAGWSMPAG